MEAVISEWDVDLAELELEVAPDAPAHKVALSVRARPGNSFHLWTWSVEDDYFKTPARFGDLVDILIRFISAAAADSRVSFSVPAMSGSRTASYTDLLAPALTPKPRR